MSKTIYINTPVNTNFMNNVRRIACLDGLRGLMALNVILCHFVCVYYPEMYFTSWADTYGGEKSLRIFSETSLNALVNGNIAVQFFFILTGFLTALIIFNKQHCDLWGNIRKRYLRLLPMVAAATIFAFILMKLGLMYHLRVTDSARNSDFLLDYNNFIPTIKNLIYNIFVRPFLYNSQYIGPFWYIKYEFWGYIMTTIICIVSKGYRWRRLGYIIIFIVLWWNNLLLNYSTFIFGIFLADLYYYTDKNTSYLSKYYSTLLENRYFLGCCFLIGTFLATIPLSPNDIYQELPFLQKGLWHFESFDQTVYRSLGLCLSLWSILHINIFQRTLEYKPIQWMGKVSFSTYAFHWPLMLSVEAYLFMNLVDKYSYNFSAIGAFILTLPVIYLVSYLSWLTIENKPNIYQKLGNFITNRLSNRRN